jgi:hypothetical protein
LFTPDSRYAQSPTYTVDLPDGGTVTAVTIPAPRSTPVIGYYPRQEGERLDLIAVRFLNAPTAFWRLCDANDSLVPGALAARPLIGIPPGAAS